MTHPIRKGLAGAVVAAVALPGAALAAGPHSAGDVSGRTKTNVKRVHRILARAIDAIDDGDDTAAIAKLGKVDARLAKALKAASRQADGDKGPGSLGAVASAADEVALETAAALDSASQELSDALVTSLDGALDDRDAIVGLLDDEDVLSEIADDSGDEAAAFTEGVEDDTLVDSAKTALGDAATQATATQTAASEKAGTAEEETGEDDPAAAEDEDCPQHGGGPRGPQGGPTGATGPSDSQGAPSRRV